MSVIAEHGDEAKDVKFEMRVTGRYRDCLNRQISEALAIRNAPQGSLLNSKSEFYQPNHASKRNHMSINLNENTIQGHRR